MLSPYDYELLSRFRDAPQAPQSDQDRWEFNRLQREGYIFPEQTEDLNVPGSTGQCAIFWEITEKGKAFLKESDEVARQHDQEERNQRRNYRVAVWQIVVSVLIFLAGMIFENRTAILDIVRRFLG